MPWGGHKTGEGVRGMFDKLGKERWKERSEVVQYRSWNFFHFMFSARASVASMVRPRPGALGG